jgi:hypothetical protein
MLWTWQGLQLLCAATERCVNARSPLAITALMEAVMTVSQNMKTIETGNHEPVEE